MTAKDYPSVVIVTGPTASGKSALAARLAGDLNGSVINADSMQIYEGLSILTARPGPEELARAPHRLYGVLAPSESCSAGRWRGLALAEIETALAQGRLPILCGGTGLYLRALTEGISEIPEIPAETRAAARALHAEIGGAALHARLAARDPKSAARLHENDSQRLIRAWEVLEATGKPLSAWHETQGAAPGFTFRRIVVQPPRDALYASCDARFEAMLRAGALEEVRALLARELAPSLPAMKALAVPELIRHLRGECDLESAAQAARTATRRYAKRQTTWLRGEAERQKIQSMTIFEKYSESIYMEIFPKIREFVLTPSW